jgi:hypothetical protein
MWTYFELAVRLAAGGLLIVAGVGKLRSVGTWRQVWLASYQLLPRPLVGPVARLLPVVELTCGVTLLLGALGRPSAIAAGVLLALLTLAVAVSLLRGLTLTCGCFGGLERVISWRVVVRNCVLVTAVGAVAGHGLKAPSVTTLVWPLQLLLVAAIVTVTAALIALSQSLRRRRLLAMYASAAPAWSAASESVGLDVSITQRS